ncbi:MAG: hypothetical protein K5842_00740 [Bacteroidales bacterium]|nr:hypothetical protein [Bacteroidales bacterium]
MDTLVGNLRRYHVESEIQTDALGTVYRAFARRRAGRGLKRRYYALLAVADGASLSDFNEALQRSILSVPHPVHIEEEFLYEGRQYVVVAKGVARRRRGGAMRQFYNRGYLMLILAALILILLIIRHFAN